MSSLLQDSRPSPPPADGAAPITTFRPYACPKHTVTRNRYITSNDPRGYLPVYEYPVNGQWIMVDADNGYVLWTGIWKALGNAKADIVKMLESQPDLAPQLRRVRGGYLKIQGTWINYEIALRLARRVAWPIRDDLIPIFGPTFPSTCLSPDQPGYGQLSGAPSRRKTRRPNPSPGPNPAALPSPPPHTHPNPAPEYAFPAPTSHSPMHRYTTYAPSLPRSLPQPQPHSYPPLHDHTHAQLPYPHQHPYPHPQAHPHTHSQHISLPPISALACSESTDTDASAVLRRLRQDDNDWDAARSRSLSAPPPNLPPAQGLYEYGYAHASGSPPW